MPFHKIMGSRIVRALRRTCPPQLRTPLDPATSQPDISPSNGTALRPNSSINSQRRFSCAVPRNASSAAPFNPVQA